MLRSSSPCHKAKQIASCTAQLPVCRLAKYVQAPLAKGGSPETDLASQIDVMSIDLDFTDLCAVAGLKYKHLLLWDWCLLSLLML